MLLSQSTETSTGTTSDAELPGEMLFLVKLKMKRNKMLSNKSEIGDIVHVLSPNLTFQLNQESMLCKQLNRRSMMYHVSSNTKRWKIRLVY